MGWRGRTARSVLLENQKNKTAILFTNCHKKKIRTWDLKTCSTDIEITKLTSATRFTTQFTSSLTALP